MKLRRKSTMLLHVPPEATVRVLASSPAVIAERPEDARRANRRGRRRGWTISQVVLFCLGGCSGCSKPAVAPTDDARTANESGAPERELGISFADIDPSRCTDVRKAPDGTYATPLATSPAIKWQCLLAPGYPDVEAPVAWPDGQVVVTSIWGGIQSVSKEGKLQWTLPPPAGPMDRDKFLGYRPVGLPDAVLFGDGWWPTPEGFAKVHAVTRGGAPRWDVSLDGPFPNYIRPVTGPFAVGGVVWAGGGDSRLYAVEAASGAIRKRRGLPGPLHDLVINGQGDLLLDLTNQYDARLVAIDAAGSIRWARVVEPGSAHPRPGSVGIRGLALLPSGDLLVNVSMTDTGKPEDSYSRLLAVDIGCGRPRWAVEVKGSIGPQFIVGLDGTAYFTPDTKSLVALSATGTMVFTKGVTTLLGDSAASAQIVAVGPLGADGVLHLLVRGVKDAQVQRSVVAGLSTKGELRWQVPVDGLVLSGSEPVLTREGLLVAGASGTSTEGKSSIYLIGVQTTSPGLAASSWPRHYHDNLSTGYLGTPLD